MGCKADAKKRKTPPSSDVEEASATVGVDAATRRVEAAMAKKTKKKPEVRAAKRPPRRARVEHELSRSCFVVRGLKGDVRSKCFFYGKGRTYTTQAAAKKEADACAKKG